MPIEWDRPLRTRRGANDRLRGLDIYFDFDWRTVFKHNRSVFPRGQSLAQLIRRECPPDKKPCLLLTEREEVPPSIQETETNYVVVVPIHDYLNNAGADAASSYYARLLGGALTQLTKLSDATYSAAELHSFLDEQLTPEMLKDWFERAEGRVEVVRRLVTGEAEAVPTNVATALRGIESEDTDLLTEIARYLERVNGGEKLDLFFSQMTRTSPGREAAYEVLVQRLPERIADIRQELTGYVELIADADSNETAVQAFLEESPWIVGLSYVRARARVPILRGTLDFVLDRHDGFFDVLELKGPQEPIIVEPAPRIDGRPHPASAYSLSPALANAIAQAHQYRSLLDMMRDQHLRDQFGLADARQPQIMILIGKSSSLSDSGREILRQLNLSLHRVEIIPYDVLAERTRGILTNLETLLGMADPVVE